MTAPTVVTVPTRPLSQLDSVIGPARADRLGAAANEFRDGLGGRTVWNVSSTAAGGGVAEMVQSLIGYVLDAGIDARWAVIAGDTEFFAVTKRLHNHIHGYADGDGALEHAERAHYDEVTAANAQALTGLVAPGDLVLLHDPQTAGLAGALARHGARVVWRCHIGSDRQSDLSRGAWEFLRPYLAGAHAYVFSRRSYAPDWLPDPAVWIIPPSIDPYSPKNQPMDPDVVSAVLRVIGLRDGGPAAAPPTFTRRDGTDGVVSSAATVTTDGLPADGDRLLVEVSRWDRLKDMSGVLRGFAEHVAPGGDGYLVLAGPAVAAVTDDPEGAAVLAECQELWRCQPAAVRARSALVTLPLGDIDENAAMVNALQRRATVVAQKSLAEGFGLTVAEAMWKARPVVGSAVGGIGDQIADGTGVLLPDPGDLAAFGAAVRRLLDDPDGTGRMGAAAHAYIHEHFIGDLHLIQYARLFGRLLDQG
jgi:trehalose synthase